MVSQQIANLPRVHALSAFESRRLRHVSVAQLAERRVVAAEFVESYSIRHPTPVRKISRMNENDVALSTS